MSLLEVDNVVRAFGSLVAVNGVSLKVEPGDLRAVIGPNGAGKTTFFNLISGFFPPSSGRIRFRDRDITAVPARYSSPSAVRTPTQRSWSSSRAVTGLSHSTVPPCCSR